MPETGGNADPVAALAEACRLLQRGMPGKFSGIPPVVVLCGDGGWGAGATLVTRSLQLLSTARGHAKLIACAFSDEFSGRMLPTQFVGRLPEPWQGVWELCSALPGMSGRREIHALSINDWPVDAIVELFAPPAPPVEETPVAPEPPAENAALTEAVATPAEELQATEPAPEPVATAVVEAPEPPDPSSTPESVDPLANGEPTAAPEPPSAEEAAPEPPEPPIAMPAPEAAPEPPAPTQPATAFRARGLWAAKMGNSDAEWEDAFAINEASGVVCVSDGAGEGIFAKIWARQLVDRFVSERPDLTDTDATATWVRSCRVAWNKQIDYPNLRWSQQSKVDSTGAAATLLGLRVWPTPGRPGEYEWESAAVGDSCLFRLLGNEILATFPLVSSRQFALGPGLVRSKTEFPAKPVFARGTCRAGDAFVLATDAVAQVLFEAIEAGPVDWARFETIDQDEWRGQIDEMRRAQRIVNDDCTLVFVRVGPPPAGV
jgi:hypothetical protein